MERPNNGNPISVLDLVIEVLNKHEKALDEIVERIEIIAEVLEEVSGRE